MALLRIIDAPAAHPCVKLDLTEPASGPNPDLLRLDALTLGEHAPRAPNHSCASLFYEGPVLEEGWTLLKLRGGQVVRGFSGGPLLNLRTGGVCALIDSSRNERADLGGFGMALSCFLDLLPGLKERNAAFHHKDLSWDAAVVAERDQAMRRSGASQYLPLVEPVARLVWDVEDPPSDLLRARYAVVPLVGRDELLGELMLWRESDRPLDVVALMGAGGMGKTRAALEVCLQAGSAGWTAGVLSVPDRERQPEALDVLASWPGRLLVVVDYAETRPDLVVSLILRLLRRSVEKTPARVVLVVRRALTRGQLVEAFTTNDAREEMAGVLRRAKVVPFSEDGQPLDREELFRQALRAFSSRLGGRMQLASMPKLDAGHFGRPLFVLLAALLQAEDPGCDVDVLVDHELLTEVIDRHEAHYWHRWNERLQSGLDRTDQRLLVALASLLGAATEKEALALVRLSPSFADASAERLGAVVRWLSHLYVSRESHPAVVAPLEPDLLAEALVASELSRRPELIRAALEGASEQQLPRLLFQLARAAANRTELANQASEALERLSGIVGRTAVVSLGAEEILSILRTLVQTLPYEDQRWLQVVGAITMGAGQVFRNRLEVRMAIEGLRTIDSALANWPDPTGRAAIRFRLATLLAWGTGELEEAEASGRLALALYEQVGDRSMVLLVANELAHLQGLRGDVAGQTQRASEVAAAAEEAGERYTMMQALGTLGEAELFVGQFEAAEATWRRTLDLAEETGEPHHVTLATSFLACLIAVSGRVEHAVSLTEHAKRVNPAYSDNLVVESETLIHWVAGDFPRAVANAEQVARRCQSCISRRRAWALAFGALAAAERSLDKDAKRYLRLGMETYDGRPWTWFTDAFDWVEGVLAWRDGRSAEGRRLIEQSSGRMLQMSAWPWAAFALTDLAELAFENQDLHCLQRTSSALQEIALSIERPPYTALAAMAAGWCQLACGSIGLAVERTQEAVALLGTTGFQGFLARALDLRGQALLKMNCHQAIGSLERAADLFRMSGSVWRLRRTKTTLAGLG